MPRSISISSRSTRRCGPCSARRSPPSTPTWHARFDDVPAGPMLLVANEFFDALPVRQFEKTPRGWASAWWGWRPTARRCVWRWRPASTPFASLLPDAPAGAQAELSEAGRASPPPSARAAPRRRLGADRRLRLRPQRPRRLAAGRARSSRRGPSRSARRDRPERACRFRSPRRGHRHADLRTGRPGRLPAAAGHHAACRDIESARRRGPARRHRRGIGALDRARPNGHPVPRHGRGRRQKRRAGRLSGHGPSDTT